MPTGIGSERVETSTLEDQLMNLIGALALRRAHMEVVAPPPPPRHATGDPEPFDGFRLSELAYLHGFEAA
ncbi:MULTISPECIES: hypothetical protein [unclassified Frankia]|uniref:hypothetical protein n=1 Tax=unclassified Frankia TaxID=2632575 RepID=UPI0019327999|nr:MULTISPECIES: hypothetical protein [unclassified Frankia]MBL7487451.1 hypothetical protein [Frankia sp. AgW1.1]MBL7618812.1 hypothetical protein [Frankia sp. AgB1.8]